MLVERKSVRQIAGEGFRRWFSDEYFDLIVWYEGEARADSTADVVAGFQLCYDKRGQERSLSWRREGGFSHDLIDVGENPGQPNMNPVLQPGGELSEAVVKRFRYNSLEVGLSIQNLVCTKLGEYRKACPRSGAGRAAGLARS
jgi:hypothetical protein